VCSLSLCSERRCTVKRAALALAVLVASVALGQQTAPRTPAEPQTSITAHQHKAARMSETDKLTVINDCTREVLAAHPSVPEKDVKAYCEGQLKSYSSRR
jgi:hypothetical protein